MTLEAHGYGLWGSKEENSLGRGEAHMGMISARAALFLDDIRELIEWIIRDPSVTENNNQGPLRGDARSGRSIQCP